VDRLERLVHAGEYGPHAVLASTFKGPKEWLSDKRVRGAFERKLERTLKGTPYVIKYEMDSDGLGAHAHLTAAQTVEAWQMVIAAERKDEFTHAVAELESLYRDTPEAECKPQWAGYVDREEIERWAGYMAKETYQGGLPSTKDIGSKYSRE
jgi:hypothetical protein